MGKIITALVLAGLRVEFVHELSSTFGRFKSLQRQQDCKYRFPPIFSVRTSRA